MQINGRDFYLDGYLKDNLDIAKKIILKDWDMLFVIDGMEGSGKSVLAQQCAFYLDNTLEISRICFTPDEFRKAILKAERYQAVIYDEAYGGMNSRASMSIINRTLVAMLAQIRQKNLFVFIVQPCFFELDKYVAVWRSRALLHVYTGDQFERGFFSFYNSEKKKTLYLMGKKLYQYLEKPNFRGRFTKDYVVDDKMYREKKLNALSDVKFKIVNFDQRNALIYYMYTDLKMTQLEISKSMNKYAQTPLQVDGVESVISVFNKELETGVTSLKDEDQEDV